MVKLSILAMILMGCGSSAPEDTGTQAQEWFNTCEMDYTPIVSETDCRNAIHFTCKDGDSQWMVVEALGYNYIGTVCFQDQVHTYYYVCGVNDKNQAWVYCNNL
jgi:hypothetical protein